MSYAEVPRPSVRKLEHYVKEMAAGGKMSEYGNRTKVQSHLAKIYKIIRQQQKMSKSSQLEIKTLYADVIRSLAMNEGQIMKDKGGKSGKRGIGKKRPGEGRTESIPFLHLKCKEEHGWEYSKKLTGLYLEGLERAAQVYIVYVFSDISTC
jgi:fatty acid synthase subunit alpha